MDAVALLARWSALSTQVRRVIATGAAVVIAMTIVGAVATHPQESALFASPLHPGQLSEVEERLASWNIAFTPSGDNVLVASKHRSSLLLRLSMAGVPHMHIDGSGDLLAKLGALTPQAVIDAQARNGLAGDIELGLRGIDGVQEARVIIAPAKQGYFADEASRPASASVRLTLVPGMHLARAAVSGIRSFVAAGVPGLDARNVTILDDRGVALGQNSDGDEGAALQYSLQSALDAAVGAGASIVRVRIEYDQRATKTQETRRSPLSAIAISTTTRSERYEGDGKRYDRSNQQIERGSEVQEISASSPPGRVMRISAAVFVDASRVADLVPVRELSAATLGIDPHRGDTLEVEAVAFPHARLQRKDWWWLAYGAIVPLLPTLVLAVAALIALRWSLAPLASMARGLSRRASIARTASVTGGIAPASVRASLANEPAHTAAAIISALPAATAAAVLDMYPHEERAAIIRRMQRPASPLLADAESFIARA